MTCNFLVSVYEELSKERLSKHQFNFFLSDLGNFGGSLDSPYQIAPVLVPDESPEYIVEQNTGVSQVSIFAWKLLVQLMHYFLCFENVRTCVWCTVSKYLLYTPEKVISMRLLGKSLIKWLIVFVQLINVPRSNLPTSLSDKNRPVSASRLAVRI